MKKVTFLNTLPDISEDVIEETQSPYMTTPRLTQQEAKIRDESFYKIEAPQTNHMLSNPFSPRINCLDFSDHHVNCRICSKLYSNDYLIYLMVIFFLGLICVVLFKKVVELHYK